MKWITEEFNDFIKLNRGFDLPNDKIKEGPYPVVASTEIKAHHDTFKVKAPGVVTGRSGSLGTVQYVKKDFWPLNTSLYVKDFKGNNPSFVYYYLKTMHLELYNSGAGVPTLNQNHLHHIKVVVPEAAADQKRIAFILSHYDDLIEINKRRIALLEESARELYKEWFVRMRFPGWEDIKIEKGVPYDWDYKELKQFGKIVTGKTPSTDNQDNFGGDIPFIKTPDMHDCIFLLDTQETLSEKGANSQKKCLLPPLSVCISCIGTVGVVGITTTYSQTNQQINSIIPSNKCYSYYLYFACESLKSTIEMYGANGATMTNLNKSKFGKLKLLCPKDDSLFIRFDQKVSPLMSVILNLQKQNKKLSLQRDRLLPRLMSGQLEV
jgi:type I restriction enzyme S subunit